MSRLDSRLARAEQLFKRPAAQPAEEDRRLALIKRALGLLRKDGTGPFTCARVAQKGAECGGNGITSAALNMFMSQMTAQQRAELEKLGLAPRQVRDDAVARSFGPSDPDEVERRYRNTINELSTAERTVRGLAAKLRLPITCVTGYLYDHADLAAQIRDYKRPS